MHELSFSFQYGRSPHTSWGIPTSPYFNSYPCVKGNLATAVILLPPRLFQFTPLHEGRYAGRPCRPRFLPDFNSRPCAKGDGPSRSPELAPAFIFQFTPLREGRRWPARRPLHRSKFQFTPLREGRRHPAVCFLPCSSFQFTPLREGRHPLATLADTHLYFNSRPYARGDRVRGLFVDAHSDFNSRPYARGDSKIRQIITSVLLQNYQISNILSQVQLEWVKKASISRPCSSVFLRLPPSIFCIGMVGAPSQ